MKKYKLIYSDEEIKEYCNQILYSRRLNSIKEVPKDYLNALFKKPKKYLRGICNMKEGIIK
jgi:hypothetical protein